MDTQKLSAQKELGIVVFLFFFTFPKDLFSCSFIFCQFSFYFASTRKWIVGWHMEAFTASHKYNKAMCSCRQHLRHLTLEHGLGKTDPMVCASVSVCHATNNAPTYLINSRNFAAWVWNCCKKIQTHKGGVCHRYTVRVQS